MHIYSKLHFLRKFSIRNLVAVTVSRTTLIALVQTIVA